MLQLQQTWITNMWAVGEAPMKAMKHKVHMGSMCGMHQHALLEAHPPMSFWCSLSEQLQQQVKTCTRGGCVVGAIKVRQALTGGHVCPVLHV